MNVYATDELGKLPKDVKGQLVKFPVFDKQCVPCHREHPKAPDMSYASLARHDRVFSYPGEDGLNVLGVSLKIPAR